MMPIMRPCHDCGVMPGELHEAGCDSPTCTICGIQLLQCDHYPIGNSVHTGIESQDIRLIAEILGLFCKWTDNGWQKTTRDDPEGDYDLNEAVVIYQKTLMRLNKRMQKRK